MSSHISFTANDQSSRLVSVESHCCWNTRLTVPEKHTHAHCKTHTTTKNNKTEISSPEFSYTCTLHEWKHCGVTFSSSHRLSGLTANVWLITSHVRLMWVYVSFCPKSGYFQTQTHTHTHPLETGNRCEATTPSHAEYTPPRGLATKTTSAFNTVSQLDEKEEKET